MYIYMYCVCIYMYRVQWEDRAERTGRFRDHVTFSKQVCFGRFLGAFLPLWPLGRNMEKRIFAS